MDSLVDDLAVTGVFDTGVIGSLGISTGLTSVIHSV